MQQYLLDMPNEVKIGTPYVNVMLAKCSDTSASAALPKYQNTIISQSAKSETQMTTAKLDSGFKNMDLNFIWPLSALHRKQTVSTTNSPCLCCAKVIAKFFNHFSFKIMEIFIATSQ